MTVRGRGRFLRLLGIERRYVGDAVGSVVVGSCADGPSSLNGVGSGLGRSARRSPRSAGAPSLLRSS